MQTGDRRSRLRSISLLSCPLVIHPWCLSDFSTPWKISNTLTFHLIICKEVIELPISTMLLRRPKAIMLEQMRWKESATGDEISCRPLRRPRMHCCSPATMAEHCLSLKSLQVTLLRWWQTVFDNGLASAFHSGRIDCYLKTCVDTLSHNRDRAVHLVCLIIDHW